MAKLIFGMNMSLDGFVDHDKFAPGPELFQHFIEQTRGLSGSIYGRGLYELMRYWDGDAWDQHDPATGAQLREFAQAWRRQPKWVVSRSLKEVGPNATLVGEEFEATIRGLRADLEGRIDVGGPSSRRAWRGLGWLMRCRFICGLLCSGVATRSSPAHGRSCGWWGASGWGRMRCG